MTSPWCFEVPLSQSTYQSCFMKYFELMTNLIGNAVIALSTHSDVTGLILGWFVCVALLKWSEGSAEAQCAGQYPRAGIKRAAETPGRHLWSAAAYGVVCLGQSQSVKGRQVTVLSDQVKWCFPGLILQGAEYLGFLPATPRSQGQTASLQGQTLLYCGPFKWHLKESLETTALK